MVTCFCHFSFRKINHLTLIKDVYKSCHLFSLLQEKFKREFKKRCLCCKLGFQENLQDYGDKTCTSMHTHASSIRSNCANSSVRVKFPINIYHNSTYSAGLTSTGTMHQSPLVTSNSGRGRNGLLYSSGLNHRKSDSDRWCNNEYRDTCGGGGEIGGTECAERYSMVYHKVNNAGSTACGRPLGDKRHIYQQFETSLVDNNNKCLCKYDDEHYDRL